jgi:hypothetical protein
MRDIELDLDKCHFSLWWYPSTLSSPLKRELPNYWVALADRLMLYGFSLASLL